MDSKAMRIFLASFLLISTAVSSDKEEILVKGPESQVAKPGSDSVLLQYLQTKPAPGNEPVKAPPPPPPSPKVSLSPPPPPLLRSPPAPVKAPPPPPSSPTSPVRPPRNPKECYPLCVVRCRLHSRKKVCLRACVTCCDRCKCVPPGQFGNKDKCGDGKCYANMTTRGGKPKCP